MTPPTFNPDFLVAVEQAVMDRSGSRYRDEITFTCPFPDHPDEHPSARYNVTKTAFYCPVCDAGGGVLKLTSLIGLDQLQVGAEVSITPLKSFASSETSLTVAELAEAKGIDEAFLRSVGLADVTVDGTKMVRIVYGNPDGTQGPVRYRRCLEKGNPDLRFRWKAGSKVRLYGLDRLPESGDVWLVEGESDCWTLWQAGEAAVGLPGASTWNDDRDAEYLERFDRIFAIVEPDTGGETFRRKLMESRLRDRIHLVSLSRFEAKDVGELYLADRESFAERLAVAQLAARPLADVRSANDAKAVREAEALARNLLDAQNVLTEIRKAITAYGYAGDTTPAEIAYLALTSTAMDDPVNVAFIAPSAAGKNAAMDGVRDFFPEEIIYEIEAGSPTTLIYGPEDYRHRCVLYAEADSIPDEGAVASAVRNLAWKKRLVYDVTERNEETGKFESRRIEKAGPTSIVTTSTRSLAKQLGTRIFEVSIPDDAYQTRMVMLAHAAKVMPGYTSSIDLAPLVAYQRWLRLAGERRVVIPFAATLMGILPANAVRMRRDAKQLLGFIQVVAFLHQCTRERTNDGAIIATIDDYAIVRELLAPTLDAIITEGVNPGIRETVNAVPADGEISLSALAKAMNLSTSTVDYRVGKALAGGWLVNREERKHHPKRLARGIPLPEAASAMPDPETLERAWRGEESEVPNEQGGEPPVSPPPSSMNVYLPSSPFDLYHCRRCGGSLPDDRDAICYECGAEDDDMREQILEEMWEGVA